MLRYLLDTDTCIYASRTTSGKARKRFLENEGHMAISTVTLFELIYGAEKSQRPAHNLSVVESFTARLDILPFAAKAALHAGQIRSELESKGMPIGAYDVLIAGHARAEGLVLVTNNAREFKRVAGLRTENWA